MTRHATSILTLTGRRGYLLVGLASAGFLLAACYDRGTGPNPRPSARAGFVGDPNYASNNSSASGSYDGVIDTVYGGAPKLAIPTGTFRYPTFIQAHVSGTVNQIAAALPGDNFSHGPTATADNPYMWGVMAFQSGGGIWWATDTATTLRVVTTIFAFRNDAGGQPTGDYNHCGWAGYALCWSWAGAAHFDFTRIHVDLTVSPTEIGHAPSDTTVTFTAGMGQTYFPGNPYPVDMSELEWHWIPSAANSADTLVDCTTVSGSSCTRVITESGTMYMSAYVNGEQQQKSVSVSIVSPLPCWLDLLQCREISPGETAMLTVLLNSLNKWSDPTCALLANRFKSMLGNQQIIIHGSWVNGTGSVFGAQLLDKISIWESWFTNNNAKQLFYTVMHEAGHVEGIGNALGHDNDAELQAQSCYVPVP